MTRPKNRPLRRASRLCAGLLLAGAFVPAAHASECAFASVVGVNFGGYDVFSPAPLDSTGSVTLRCTGVGPGDTVLVSLSRGTSASFFPRLMPNPRTPLAYDLYLDAARLVVWGDGTGGSSAYGPVQPVDGSDLVLPIYGRVPAQQNVMAGSYSDTLVVTIQF